MSYASASDVYSLAAQLIANASAFTASTNPTLAQVNAWLSSGCSLIESRLAGMGYAAIPTTSGAYGLAQQAEACYGAWMANRSSQYARTGTDDNTMAEAFKKDFDYHLKILAEMDLGNLGVPTVDVDTLITAGGINISDKQTLEADGDRVPPRFTRDMFKNPESLAPTGNTSACGY